VNLAFLQTFCEVAKWGSFTRAADELGYAQSSVTMQIQKLEETYEVVLVERYGRKMRLTDAGEELLRYAKQMISLYEVSKETLRQQKTGTLKIGTIETVAAFYLPTVMQTFREMYPEMSVLLHIGSEPSVIKSVKEGECDLALIYDVPFADPDLQGVSLGEEELVIVMPPGHEMGKLDRVKVQDLQGASLICTEEGCTYRGMLLRALKVSGVPFHISCEFGSIEAIKQCVARGVGIALLPRMTVREEVDAGKLLAIPFVQENEGFHVQVLTHKKKWMSQALQDFLDLLK
jgi:DNA-binding transcriptional LysR family regulator